VLSILPPASTGPLWQLGGAVGGGGSGPTSTSASSGGPAGALGLSLPRVYLAVHGRNFLRNPTFSKVTGEGMVVMIKMEMRTMISRCQHHP
jgi:hypothetical protein